MSVQTLFESESYLVVNKPYDMYINSNDINEKNTVACHIGSPDCHLSSSASPRHFVQRLDYATGGVLCVAKSRAAAAAAGRLLQRRLARKYYLAVVRGHVAFTAAQVLCDIGEEPPTAVSWHRMVCTVSGVRSTDAPCAGACARVGRDDTQVETNGQQAETDTAQLGTDEAQRETGSLHVESDSARLEKDEAWRDTDSACVERISAPVQTDSARVEADSARAEKNNSAGERIDEALAENNNARVEKNSARAEKEIARVESDETRARDDNARAEMDSARAETDSARAEMDSALAETERARAEMDSSRVEIDSARVEMDSARAETDRALVGTAKAREETEGARTEGSSPRAPAAGAESAGARGGVGRAGTEGARGGMGRARRPRAAHTRLLLLETAWRDADPVSVLLLQPVTGRRHQLRVHCACAGHAVLGDTTYGGPRERAAPRMFLHAARLVLPLAEGALDVAALEPLVDELAAGARWTPLRTLHAFRTARDLRAACDVLDALRPDDAGDHVATFKCTN